MVKGITKNDNDFSIIEIPLVKLLVHNKETKYKKKELNRLKLTSKNLI